MQRLFLTLATALTALASGPVPTDAATLDPQILIVIESPRDVMSGIALVNGFALSKKGSIDYVTWSIDGSDKGYLPYGGSRGDVAAVHPGYADSMDPGFATAWNYNLFTAGEHEIVVRAFDDKGGYNEVKKKFRTTRFGGGADTFLTDDEIEIDTIPLAHVRLYPKAAQGDLFNVELVWSKGAQQWVIQEIDKRCDQCGKPGYAAPTLDTVRVRADDSVEILWSGGSPVVAYELERRGIPSLVDEPWEHLGTAAGTERRFILPAPAPGGIVGFFDFTYRIRGLGAAAKTAYSNVLTATTP